MLVTLYSIILALGEVFSDHEDLFSVGGRSETHPKPCGTKSKKSRNVKSKELQVIKKTYPWLDTKHQVLLFSGTYYHLFDWGL